MTKRQRMIVAFLMNQNQPVSIQDIADHIGCSEKTVRNEWKMIDDYFLSESLGFVSRKRSQGVVLEQTDVEKERLKNALASDSFSSSGDKDLRLSRLAERLLDPSTEWTLTQLSEHFFLRPSIIREDIRTLQSTFERFQLSIMVKPNVGIVIEGSEVNRRAALAALIDKSLRSDGNIKEWFSPFDWESVRRVIRKLEKQHHHQLTDQARTSLIIHILLSASRMMNDKYVEVVTTKSDYPDFFQELMKNLEHIFNMKWKKAEKTYLFFHFQSAKLELEGAESDLFQTLSIDQDVLRFTNRFVEKMSEHTGYPFLNDQDLFKALALHLHGSLIRINHDLRIHNPLMTDIRKNYPYLFEMVLESLEQLKPEMKWPDDEVAYLTIHFQVALEKLERNSDSPIRLLLVCPMGVGVSRLMATKLEHIHQAVDIVGTASEQRAEMYSKTDADLIISTVPLPNAALPVVVVSPFIKQSEQQAIEKQIHDYHKESASVLKSLLGGAENIVFPKATDRYSIIHELVTPLIESGRVDRAYLESALARERRSATYIGGGVAIPHGDPRWVTAPCVVMGVLRNPVQWDEKRVSVVLLLATQLQKGDEIKQLFQEISHLSDQPDFIARLSSIQSEETIFTLL